MRIEQKIDPHFVKKFIRHQRIGRALASSSMAAKLLRRMSSLVLSVNNDLVRRNTLLNFGAVRSSGDTKAHGYTDRYGDLVAALNYAAEIAHPDFGETSQGESFILYREQLETMRRFLREKRPAKVFNFGICYAHIDSILAQEFPDIQFVGIDLSKYNKAFNDCEFGHIPNLKILTGDVFAEFEGGSYAEGVLFHSRTLVLLPSDFIERLYGAAHRAGFRWVVGFEQNGLSEETQQAFVFGQGSKSVYWRDRMYVHDYLSLVAGQGFEVSQADLFSTNHTSPDYRVLRFTAERR